MPGTTRAEDWTSRPDPEAGLVRRCVGPRSCGPFAVDGRPPAEVRFRARDGRPRCDCAVFVALTAPGRRTCAHIEAVVDRCGWWEYAEDAERVRRCPNCNGPTSLFPAGGGRKIRRKLDRRVVPRPGPAVRFGG
jgi:hypothetical protein